MSTKYGCIFNQKAAVRMTREECLPGGASDEGRTANLNAPSQRSRRAGAARRNWRG
jgi:hypothetical protein